MNIQEMKNILAKKLKEENSYLDKSHISIEKQNDAYIITLKDYEHIYFKMEFYKDEDFGYVVSIYDSFEGCNLIFVDSKKGYDVENALIELGYHIAVCF